MQATKFNPRKTSTLSLLQDLYSQSKSVAVVDFTGLKVSQATELRQLLKKSGNQFVVAKNTLFKLATKLPQMEISGISGYVFCLSDEVTALKIIKDFAKKNTLPTFKFGLLGDQVLTAEEVSSLASLPDKNTLRAQVVSGLNSPIFKLVYNLNWNLGQLVRTLDAVAKSKEVN